MSFRQPLIDLIDLEARPAYKIGHQHRLYALTKEIAARFDLEITYDDDVVFAAAYLHDLGVFIGHRPETVEELERWDHVEYTCARAPGILDSLGFPAEKIPAVLACIREHQPKDEPQSLEAALLRDADILEQLGAIGILRTVAKVGSDTRFHTFTDARNTLRRALDELPPRILLRATRTIAAPRIAILHTFLEMLDTEAGDFLG